MKLKDIFSVRNLRTETNTIAGKILVLFKKEYEIPFSDKTITAINDDKISLLNKQKLLMIIYLLLVLQKMKVHI